MVGGGAGALAELEVEGAVAAGVGGYRAEGLARAYLLAVADADAGEIAVDAVEVAVADDDDVLSADVGNGTDLAVEHAAGLGAGVAREVDALTVERDAG